MTVKNTIIPEWLCTYPKATHSEMQHKRLYTAREIDFTKRVQSSKQQQKAQ